MDERESFSNGLLWAYLASKYFGAAEIVYQTWYMNRTPTAEILLGMIEPISQLYGQSIELNLKAFLRLNGMKHGNVHNLRDLFGQCVKNGLQVADPHDIVGKLSDVFHQSQDPDYLTKYAVRYPKEPGAPYPVFIAPGLMREVAAEIELVVQRSFDGTS